jgi:hypothetical protein
MDSLLFMEKSLLVTDLLVSTLADAGGEEIGSSALLHGFCGTLVRLSGNAACGEGPEQVGGDGKDNCQPVEPEHLGSKLYIDGVWFEGCVPGANESGEEDGGADGSSDGKESRGLEVGRLADAKQSLRIQWAYRGSDGGNQRSNAGTDGEDSEDGGCTIGEEGDHVHTKQPLSAFLEGSQRLVNALWNVSLIGKSLIKTPLLDWVEKVFGLVGGAEVNFAAIAGAVVP